MMPSEPAVSAVPTARRGTRIRWEIPVTVASLDTTEIFSELSRTVVVNPQGCGLRLSRSLPVGSQVRLAGLPGHKRVTARVATCSFLGNFEKASLLGLALEQPGNFWGVETPPEEWSGRKQSAVSNQQSNAEC
ncbi:MAG TPA: hypothetical protein VKW06_11525 [Candidatus Angelobacter sp.]|nr:hypothetical protein [Candidatus Angelobacter sp.]